MSPLSDPIGRTLYLAHFHPLPDVNEHGELLGTRMWRIRDGYVEYLALHRNGLANAVRAEASYHYERPAEHGPVTGHRFGTATNALDWLLRDQSPPPDLARPYYYFEPGSLNPWREPDDQGDQR